MQGVDDMVYFTDDAGTPQFAGLGWMSSICGGNHLIRNMCNLNIYQESAVNLAGVSTPDSRPVQDHFEKDLDQILFGSPPKKGSRSDPFQITSKKRIWIMDQWILI